VACACLEVYGRNERLVAMKILRSAPAAVIGAALVVSQPCFAAGDATTDTERIERAELEQNDNPTILRRRVWWENEYSNLHHGAWQNKLTLAGLYAFSLSRDYELGVRLKLPLMFANGGRVPGADKEAGLGDIEFAFATAWRLAPTFRAACGLETKFNTATPDALGDGTVQLKPLLAFGWDAARWLTLAPNFVYNDSVVAMAGAADVSNLEINVPFIFLLPDRWSTTVEYKGKVDFERANEYANSLKVGMGKLLTGWTVVFASVEVPLEAATKNFQVTAGMNFFFD
jgi:hypothetical protein